MFSALWSGPLADPRLGLGLLGILLVLALVLLAVWRREALRTGADPARQAWFAFAMRVQLLLVIACFVGPGVTALARPELGLWLLFPALFRFAPFMSTVLLGALPIVITLAAVVVIGDVERRLRGSGWTLRERLSQTGLGLAVALLPIAGLVAASELLTSGNFRAGVGCALAGFVLGLWVAGFRIGQLGMKPEAATSGPLRDRLFELAARAGVRVRQVYVLSASRSKLANAFAVRGGNIVLTDHLLEQLSRRETEAVIAHELAHLRHRHPAKLGAAFAVPFVVSALAASLGMAARIPSLGMGPLFTLAGLLGWMSLLWWAKRFEYQADLGAARLTGDAPALITALVRIARLNAFPVDWSRAQECVLTHPSVRRRALALAAAGQLTASEATSLVDAPPEPTERWMLPTSEREPVFGTSAKRSRVAATSWNLLLASVVTPALVFALLRAASVTAWPLAFALAALASFLTMLAAVDVLATAGYAAWERAIAERRARPVGDGGFVGLAPGDGGMTYEGFADWDLGYLDLDPVALRYAGERVRFALERDQIVSIELVSGLPGWFPAPRVAVRWRAADGAVHSFTVRDGRARRLREIPRQSDRLLGALRQWHAQQAPAGVRPISGGEPPRDDAVTGTPYAELASARSLLPVMPVLVALALLAALAVGLPLLPGRGFGALEVVGAGLLALVGLRLPLWRAGRGGPRAQRAKPDRHEPPAAEPGTSQLPSSEADARP